MAASLIDTSFLESLLGYNARRAALTILQAFLSECPSTVCGRWIFQYSP